eukprot:2148622-Pleurochrysis_carterae.AAC.2
MAATEAAFSGELSYALQHLARCCCMLPTSSPYRNRSSGAQLCGVALMKVAQSPVHPRVVSR